VAEIWNCDINGSKLLRNTELISEWRKCSKVAQTNLSYKLWSCSA